MIRFAHQGRAGRQFSREPYDSSNASGWSF